MPFVPKEPSDVHKRYQPKLLDLSSKSKHFLCYESGHFSQITEPEIVISATQDTVNEIKSS